jgi:hypothetical protein
MVLGLAGTAKVLNVEGRQIIDFPLNCSQICNHNPHVFGLEIREYGHRDLSRLPHGTLYPWKLALISPTNGGRSLGIVRLWTKATD